MGAWIEIMNYSTVPDKRNVTPIESFSMIPSQQNGKAFVSYGPTKDPPSTQKAARIATSGFNAIILYQYCDFAEVGKIV